MDFRKSVLSGLLAVVLPGCVSDAEIVNSRMSYKLRNEENPFGAERVRVVYEAAEGVGFNVVQGGFFTWKKPMDYVIVDTITNRLFFRGAYIYPEPFFGEHHLNDLVKFLQDPILRGAWDALVITNPSGLSDDAVAEENKSDVYVVVKGKDRLRIERLASPPVERKRTPRIFPGKGNKRYDY
jgi:hypothetical protein